MAKGYGIYADFYKRDRMVTNVKLEEFIEQSRVDEIVKSLIASAHTGVPGDGIVAVTPVDAFYSSDLIDEGQG